MGKKDQVKSEQERMDDIPGEVEEIAKSGKKSKKSKKKDFDEDDIARELEELSLEANGELSKAKENEKPPDSIENKPSNLPNENTEEQEKGKKDKNKKGKSKRKDKDDEDLDDILAELEAEYRGEKLPDKKEKPNEKTAENDSSKKESKTSKPNDSTDAKVQPKPKQSETKTKKDKSQDPAKKDKQSGKSIKEKSSSDVSQKKAEMTGTDEKKKKKGKTKEELKKEEEEAKAKKNKPNKKMLEAMKQILEKKKEAEQQMKKEELERERAENERIRKLKEQRRLEKERKERQKQKQKERLKRLKEEGKILTPKQKLEQQRAKAMLEHLKAQGVCIPGVGEKLTPVSSRQKKKKQEKEEAKIEDETLDQKGECDEMGEETEEQEEIIEEEKEVDDDDVIDDWDLLSESDEEDEEEGKSEEVKLADERPQENGEVSAESEVEDIQEEELKSHMTEAERRRDRALQRMEKRKLENEKNRTESRLRAPVVCVLGHVDHGKTKILDKLRRTNVQEGEVGGITQQIGATNVPIESIRSQTRMVKDFDLNDIKLPGLLIIDTPGHESFSNLRSRGSSLCDIAILVVDVTQGLEPQTIESISLLKKRKTPFVVALNKVDRVFEWEAYPSKDIRDTMKTQNDACKNNFEKRTSEIIQALNIQGLNAALFWENPDPRSYVSLVPTSAISGDGMGNLMSLIATMCQKRLANRLMFSHELQCTVLEVKTIQGHGTTIDVILINGQLKEGDTVILAGTEGPIVTQIRSLLTPKPMREIRVKGQYDELKVVQGALGVKIAARDLERAIAGLNLQVALHEDEVEILRDEVDREFKTAMKSIKVRDKGVYVQASTLGALEALLEFFKTNSVPYSGIRVGPVVKRDVMRASAMLEHNPMYAVILAFDVKVEKDAQELADKEGVKIFSEETIYHLGDRYVEYIKEYKKKKQDEFRHVAVFPCKLKILPDAIFNKRDPIVLGVTVDSGILRTGTPLCVPLKEFVEIGVVTSLEFEHKVVEIAKKGVSVCMKVEPLPGHTPKLFGRHFDADDILVSKISRESIDACKDYFRDDLGKNEWKLMAELKKQFTIF